jgi:uncharacterized surface protein with fasciclin (FAS1) repeats
VLKRNRTAPPDAEPEPAARRPAWSARSASRPPRTGGAREAYGALLADRDRLDGLLSYHVTAKRQDAQRLVEAGKATELAYGDVTVGGTPEALELTSTGGTAAKVRCGNVQTAYTTVFVIDEVLLPRL